MANTVEIVIRATGAEQAARILQQVAAEGAQLGRVTASGAREAQQQLTGLTATITRVEASMAGAGVNTGVFGAAIGALRTPLGAVAAASVALVAAIHTTTQAMVDNAREVKALMAVSGLSAEAADNLADTFQLLGKDSQALTNALFKMGSEIEGGGEALAKLGVSLRDHQGHLKAEGDLLLEVRDRISQMGSASQRSAVLTALFGRAGRELADVFALSSEKFRQYAERAGVISMWNDRLQDDAETYRRSLAELGLQWDALTQQVGSVVVPALTAVLGAVSKLIEAARNPIKFIIQVVRDPAFEQQAAEQIRREQERLLRGSPLDPRARVNDPNREFLRDMAGADEFAGRPPLPGPPAPPTGAELLAAQDALKAWLASLEQSFARAQALRQQYVAGEQMTQTASLQQQLAALDELQAARTSYYAQLRQMYEGDQAMLRKLGAEAAAADTAGFVQRQQVVAQLSGEARSLGQALAGALAQWRQLAGETGFHARVEELLGQFRQFGPVVQEALRPWAESVAAAEITARGLAQQTAATTAELEKMDAALATMTPTTEQNVIAAQQLVDAWERADTALAAVAESVWPEDATAQMLADLAAMDLALSEGATASQQFGAEQERLASLLDRDVRDGLAGATAGAQAFGRAFDLTSAQTAALTSALRAAISQGLDPMHPKVVALREELEKLQARGVGETLQRALATAATQAKLLGSEFDATAARVSALQQALDSQLRASLGQLTPEIERTAAALRDALETQRLERSFQNVFDSITRAFDDMATGLIQGTLDIGTAFKNLAQNLVVSFARSVIEEVFRPVSREAARFLAQMLRGGGGGGVSWSSGGGDVGVGPEFGQTGYTGFGSVGSSGLGGMTWADMAGLAYQGLSGLASLSGLKGIWTGIQGGISGFMDALGGGASLLDAAFEGIIAGLNEWAATLSATQIGMLAVGGAVGTILNIYTGIMALDEGQIGRGVGTLAGTAVGAVIGGIVGSMVPVIGTVIGALLGGALGGAAGGGIGGLFDTDWREVLERRQSRAATATGTFKELAEGLQQIQSLQDFQAYFAQGLTQFTKEGKPIGESENMKVGNLLRAYVDRMLEDAFAGTAVATTVSPEMKAKLEQLQAELEAQGFRAMDVVTELGIGLAELVLYTAGVSGGQLRPNTGGNEAWKELVSDIVDLINLFGDGTKTIQQIIADIKTRALDEIMESPIKALAVLDFSQFAKEGEKLEDTIKRMATALGGLEDLFSSLDAAIEQFSGAIVDTPARVREAQKDLKAATDAIRVELATTFNPEELLTLGQQLMDLTIARYQVEIEAVATLAKAIDELVSSLASAAQTVAELAQTLQINVAGIATEFFRFSEEVVTLSGKIAAFQAGLALMVEEIRQQGLPAVAASGLPGAALGALADIIRAALATGLNTAGEITDPTARLAALQGALQQIGAAAQAATTAIRAYYDGLREEAQATAQEQLDAIAAQRDAAREAADAALEALSEQRDALQEQLQIAREWARVAKSVRDQILRLQLGNQSPLTNPSERLALAQQEFEAALAAFRADPTAAGAARVQELAQLLLTAGQDVFTRPSLEWQALFESVTGALEEIAGLAEAQSTEESILAELESIDAQMAAVRDGLEAQLEGFTAAGQAINEDLKAKLAALSAEEAAAIKQVQDALQPLISEVLTEMKRTALAAAEEARLAQEQLNAITGGIPFEQYTALKQKEMADELLQIKVLIRDQLATLIAEAINKLIVLPPPPAPAPTPQPEPTPEPTPEPGEPSPEPGGGYATGTDWVPATGYYKLHAGEAVLTAEENRARRSGEGGVTLTFAPGAIAVNGAGDPEAVAEKVYKALRRKLEDDLRYGVAGEIARRRRR